MVSLQFIHLICLSRYLLATPDHISQGQFVLDITLKALPIYEKIFDIEYPLPKLDALGSFNPVFVSCGSHITQLPRTLTQVPWLVVRSLGSCTFSYRM